MGDSGGDDVDTMNDPIGNPEVHTYERFFERVAEMMGLGDQGDVSFDDVLRAVAAKHTSAPTSSEALYTVYLRSYVEATTERYDDDRFWFGDDVQKLVAHSLGIHDGNAGLEPRSMSTLVTDVGKRTEGQVKPQAFGDLVAAWLARPEHEREAALADVREHVRFSDEIVAMLGQMQPKRSA